VYLQQKGEALQSIDIIADTFLSVKTPVQIALPRLFRFSSDSEINSLADSDETINYYKTFCGFKHVRASKSKADGMHSPSTAET